MSDATACTESSSQFPIVGVGASAGGIEALEGFFSGMPDQPGLAVVIVTHLSPERESLLHEVVARYTAMPVHVATDGAWVRVDTVYVLPPDAVIVIAGRRLAVSKPKLRRERKPVDIFFSALAADCGEMAAGVVLSGGDGDGALGVKAIKERGGLTMAQVRDGYGPQHPGMPDSAISTGFVDFAIPADQMGARLVEFARGLPLLEGLAESSRAAAADVQALAEARTEICAILHNQVGHDFGGYKPKTFLRRVQRRMQVRQLATLEAYVGVLRDEPHEVAALFRDLLINVTDFFRDAEAFDVVTTAVIPKLFEGRGPDDTVRVWVPGCATGEEVYSIAMLLREAMDQLASAPRVQVFATDIDENALAIARAGRYPDVLLENVSGQRRARFFIADGGSFVVGKEVRDLCIFSPHSVIRDPPFSRIDLVSCRNLLIYFGPEVQNQVIPIFHYALRPGGYLFLGTSENISQFADLFGPVERKQRIFRRRSDDVQVPRLPGMVGGLSPGHARVGWTAGGAAMTSAGLRHLVEGQVLEQFAPPHVVVNGEGEVVFYSSRTGKYLEAAAGSPTRQLLALARKGLRLDLRTALREAAETARPVTREDVAIDSDDERVQVITLTIAPVLERERGEPLFLVLFADQGRSLSRGEALTRVHVAEGGAAIMLERELRETRERLQSMVEEYETALEELKSSNEELVSVNEELQSTNEELEASKEEMQSVNEELHTVNNDLGQKMEALDHANSDLQNLFDSTDVATVFLDHNLVIRSFTPSMSKIFNIRPGDRGRPITDLAGQFSLPSMPVDIAAVLATGQPVERRIRRGDDANHYLVRLSPYRNRSGHTEGVVVCFVDITSLTRAEEHGRVLLAEVQHRTRNLLAVVQAIATQTLVKSRAVDEFTVRLAALGRVQGLISGSAHEAIDLREIVLLELAAHGAAPSEPRAGGRVSVEGPPVTLGLHGVQTFALALHELATNAVKHGALRNGGGRLSVTWTVEHPRSGDPRLTLTWRERGVPLPHEPTRRGYGRKLIEQALSYTLQARTNLVFGEDGVVCTIEMPLTSPVPAGQFWQPGQETTIGH